MSEPAQSLPKLQAAIDQTSLWMLFAVLGGSGASVLALGLLMRSNQALTKRMVVGTVLHSAAWGVAVFLLSYSSFTENVPFLLGLSITSGMGAASFLDLMLMLVKQRLGISVTFNPPPKDPTP